MLSTVPLPMTLGGGAIATLGSLAVFRLRASAVTPGPGVTAEALSLKTAKLPSVAMAPPPRVIGKGTVDSIQSGLFYGYLGLIEGVTRRILDELGEATVIATGGLARAFAGHTDLIQHVEPDLTLHGLRILWLLNRGTTT